MPAEERGGYRDWLAANTLEFTSDAYQTTMFDGECEPRRLPGYLDNDVRRPLFRAGHAHAGVWIIFALVGLLYVDQADLSDGFRQLVRVTFFRCGGRSGSLPRARASASTIG